MEKDIKNKKALVAYIALCFLWGSTYIAIKIGVKDMPPLLFTSIRLLIAGGLMAAFALIKKMSFPNNLKEVVKISLTGLLILCFGMGLFVVAAQWLPAGLSSIIIASVPIILTVIELVILRRRNIGVMGVVGILIGFIGVIFLSFGDIGIGEISTKGIVFVLIACLMWSIGSLYSQQVKAKCSIVANIAIQMLAGSVGLFILGLIVGETQELIFTLESTLALIYLIIFGSIIGYSSYIYVLQHWPATIASTYTYVNPIVAIILGVLILNEVITFRIILSLVIILIGVMLVQMSKNRSLRKQIEKEKS